MSMANRIERIRDLLLREDVDGVLVTTQVNVAWLFKGRYHVNVATEEAIAAVFITHTHSACVVNNIEHLRLVAEEALACTEVHVHPWFDDAARADILKRWRDGLRVKTDVELADAFLALRTALDAGEQQQLRRLARCAAEAVEEICRTFERGETEWEVAGRVAGACYRGGIEPVVLLVGGESRAPHYRHALPTDDPIRQYAILSVCARKWGLIASVTRMVHFGTPSADFANRHRAVRFVDASLLDASRPGNTLADVFKRAIEAYAAVGFANEWQMHHQGGVAGYRSREVRATESSSWVIEEGQALAWNPSIAGVKSEDTVLVHRESTEAVTQTGEFPMEPVQVGRQSYRRPGVLIR